MHTAWSTMLLALTGEPAAVEPTPRPAGRIHQATAERRQQQDAERARRDATARNGGRRPAWSWATSRANER